VGEWLRLGIIEPSTSTAASPVHLVKKRDGTWRMTVDYRDLNQQLKPDRFPVNDLEDALTSLAGKRFFGKLDLRKGFLQIPIAVEDRHKTAFVTRDGLFHFTRMPFGPKPAPNLFTRTMQHVLRGLVYKICLVYMDDILVFGETWEEYLANLEAVLKRLSEYGLKANTTDTTKSALYQTKVDFLGHTISRNGIAPARTQGIDEFPVPTTKPQLRRFLGMANFYSKFIEGLAKMTFALRALLKAEHFLFTKEHHAEFETVKRALASAPTLAHPRFDQPFRLRTDASNKGLGAVLEQEQHDGAFL
jgi:hypothetical protein